MKTNSERRISDARSVKDPSASAFEFILILMHTSMNFANRSIQGKRVQATDIDQSVFTVFMVHAKKKRPLF